MRWSSHLLVVVLAALCAGDALAQRRAGESFRDCAACPLMVVVPAGAFLMGSAEGEPLRELDEGPQHQVQIGNPFALGKYEVTFAEWDACVAAGGCNGYVPDDAGWGRGAQPAINVNRADALAFIAWLNRMAGAPVYRLPSEAEWEYAARAGSTSVYPWGYIVTRDKANYGTDECCAAHAEGADRWMGAAPVGSFPANAFGLHDMQGNVWEWTEDCYEPDYEDRAGDGSPHKTEACTHRVIRGGSWIVIPQYMRSAYRVRYSPAERKRLVGFRVARTL
jgi:formylglycine-generating enzyme required for sulfatase activity